MAHGARTLADHDRQITRNALAWRSLVSAEDRVWHTSHVLPFLGHVALERMTCSTTNTASPSSSSSKADFVRVIVNGAVQKLPACHDGPQGSCALDRFERWSKERTELFGNVEAACGGTKT